MALDELQAGSPTVLILLCLALLPACARNLPAQADNLITFSKVDQAWLTSRGAGVQVAVIDWQFDMGRRARQKYVLPTSVVPGEEIGAMKPWHGEWMAKIVHAVAPNARIIPINARSLKQRDYQVFLMQGIRYAADHGALAVTSSMGPAIQSDALRAAIDYAHERGTIFVNVHPERIVTGDGTRPCGAKECDPRILRAGIVSVPEHTLSPDPARDLYTWPYDLEPHFKDGWGFSNGPPTVAGVMALVKAANPSLSADAIRSTLIDTAVMKDGFRVIDAAAAVAAAVRPR
jgi:hypothetical protein